MNNPTPEFAKQMANTIRMLAVDAVEKAKSGHPGAPMGMADIAEVLWNRHLAHNPANPLWPNRDRFVLSNGHGSMLLYALLHLTGYDLPMAELKNFRQLHSKTAGHPEVGVTPGVETTTGPLGQGLANAVGMALAEKLLAAEFNQSGHAVVDHFTYAFMGDGCLMEGISHEAGSLAGTLRLSKLVALYDDNGISIDGHVQDWFTDDTPKRFEAYGWNVIPAVDGHNPAAIDAAIRAAKAQAVLPHGKPTLICCKTVIGMGSPNKAGTHDVHGAALGAAEVAATREALGWSAAPFEVPAGIAAAWNAVERGQAVERAWRIRFEAYRTLYPAQAAEFERRMVGDLLPAFADKLPGLLATIAARPDAFATRKSSQNALDVLAPLLPEFFGGSADLTGSNLTNFKGCVKAGRDQWGNHLSYGVREFGMAAFMNGMALHGGYIPYGGTFLTFSDYSRNAIRMAALMKLRVIHVFTHDSIGLGEDGPTHQSVEHVPSLRIIPGLDVWRPADALETAVAWACAVQRKDGPSALCLSRQNLPRLTDAGRVDAIRRGGYVLSDMAGAQAVIVSTGSELALAIAAQAALATEGIASRVVSMPCTAIFDRQSGAYQESVLPLALPTVAIEAAQPDFWRKYVGRTGVVIGIARFGESAPAKDLYPYFGITTQRVVDAVRTLARRAAHRREGALPEQIVPSIHPPTDGVPAMKHLFDLVMFDLDGTLIETAPEIADAVNDTLRRFDLPEVTQQQVNDWIGQGTRELLLQAVVFSGKTDAAALRANASFALIAAEFDKHYQSCCGSRSHLYPEVRETLSALRERGVKLAVVTNKEGRYTATVLNAHQLMPLFDRVVSGDTLPTKKPDPAGIQSCLAAFDVPRHRALFVGDSSIDVATARNAGVTVWALPYGYNMGQPIAASAPDRIIADCSALFNI